MDVFRQIRYQIFKYNINQTDFKHTGACIVWKSLSEMEEGRRRLSKQVEGS